MSSRGIGEDNHSDLLRELVAQSRSARELIGMGSPREDGLVSFDGDRSERASAELEEARVRSGRASSKSKSAYSAAWEREMGNVEMIDDPVRMYLREIGRVNLLKAKEERILARAWRRASTSSRSKPTTTTRRAIRREPGSASPSSSGSCPRPSRSLQRSASTRTSRPASHSPS